MALVRLAECASLAAPSRLSDQVSDYSLTEVSYVLRDLSWNTVDNCTENNNYQLENEVMVDPWSSMESTNSPLSDSGPSASDDCTPSTSSEPARDNIPKCEPRRDHDPAESETSGTTRGKDPTKADKMRPRNLPLDMDQTTRRPHFLDEDYQSPSRSNIESRIPKPHFLDSPSPDEFDERSDITNPNFLDDEPADDNTHKKAGALPKRPQKIQNPIVSTPEERPHRTNFKSTLHYGLENAARTSVRDKRTSQLYQGTWPGEREVWTGHDTASVRSFSSNGSTDPPRPSSNLENKMECVYSLLSLLTLSPDNNADLSGPLLEMSRSVESCIAMRQAGCIPLLVQLIHSKLARDTRDRAAKALRNIIHTQTDDKAGRREARVWRLLEQVREYCYILEDLVESRKESKDVMEDDANKHPSQCVAALMKLSFDEEHRHVVCQLGGLQALAALVSGDQAAHGSGTDDVTCLYMRRYAGMTLTNLTFGDGNNKSLLCSFKDFMMALVEQLESPNDDMLQVTAAVLRNLSWRADTNSKQILREVGAVKGLTIAAMTCQKETTLKSVLSALWNLTAHCSMNKVALCSVDGALGFLVDMLSYNSPSKTLAIIENAGGIMRNVSSHIAVREDYRQILRERNCLSVLLQHLKSPSLTVVSNSCGTLWNLSARCPQDQQFLWDHGAVPMLRSLIHSKHKMIAMGSSAALKNLLNSKPGKSHIISLDSTARNMNLPALPTLGVRKQKALEQELDQNLAETCDNIEPATSPSTSNREEKNLYSATERQITMNLERHRMTSSSPLMGALQSQISLSHSAHLAGYLSCSNTLLKGALVSRSTNGSANNVNRSESKDSVTSTHSDSVFERATRTGKVPIPTPRTKDLVKSDPVTEVFNVTSKPKDNTFKTYPSQPPVPTPRNTTDLRTNFAGSGYDVDQEACDQPIDYSRKYSETKANANEPAEEKTESRLAAEPKKYAKKSTFGDYQETDLDQPTDYSLRYAEHQSEIGSDTSEPPGPSVNEDTIKHFCTEGTPYETPIIFSTATSMSDLRVIGPKEKPKQLIKENSEVMTHSDEKDTCSIEETSRHDDVKAVNNQSDTPKMNKKSATFDTKFSSGMISPEKPVNYCEEGTPGYFSRASSLSSLGEPTEEDCLAKKNAIASINIAAVDNISTTTVKDKEGSKAVTFACEPIETPPEPVQSTFDEQTNTNETGFVLETPLMFSRSSSMGSMVEGDNQDGNESAVSVVSEISRLTSCCVSPSDIPDSPAHSVIHSPARSITAPPTPPQPEHGTVFEERVSEFLVENTPAHFSTATSLSELTIPDDKSLLEQLDETSEINENLIGESDIDHHYDEHGDSLHRIQLSEVPLSCDATKNESKGAIPNDSCRVYHTEDTPAIFSNLGSNSNLSALSVESGPTLAPVNDASDNSNLCDSADLLEQCVQNESDRVAKNKGQSSECSSAAGVKPLTPRDEVYHSLPPYLRSPTETMEASKLGHNESSSASPPPPLPPKSSSAVAPPRPPQHTLGKKHESRLSVKSQPNTKERPKPASHTNLARNDSVSSLSLDSFGSTDREIFEETVKAGLSSIVRRPNCDLDNKEKAHSVERPSESNKHHCRHHRSLDRSDKITQHRTKVRDAEFDKNLSSGAYHVKSGSNLNDSADLLEQCIQKGIDRIAKNKGQSSECSSAAGVKPLTPRDEVYHSLPPYLRSPTETMEASKLGHNESSSVSPPCSLPPKSSSAVAPPRPPTSHASGKKHESRLSVKSQPNTKERPKPASHTNLTRNDSVSSLSLDSFGSTDREIFEETVKAGLSSIVRRPNCDLDNKEKAHSVERPSESNRHHCRHHRSLDRSDKITQHRTKVKDAEFEKNLSSGGYHVRSSSNFRDSADLLEQCIQKGIDRIAKNKGQSSECSSAAGVKPLTPRDEVYHSLPPYLRSPTETMEASKLGHNESSSVSPPSPLPPKSSSAAAPLRRLTSQHTPGKKHESRLSVKSQPNTKERPKPASHTNLVRNDSVSSLSLDSFGSTDREIFEETVKAGLSSIVRRPNCDLDNKEKAHSVERPSESNKHHCRHHRSLDRSDKITQHKTKVRDAEFEKNLSSGAYHVRSNSRFKKYDNEGLTRSPYSYHGDTNAHSLSHHSRWSKFTRFHDDGPPSLPAWIDAIPRQLERSSSLSSLSNDSFGSTDKEIFERTVKAGVSKANPKKSKNEEKLRVRSDDLLEPRGSRRRRPLPPQGALDKLDSKDRAILEEMIAKGAGEKPNAQSKNVPAPSADSASADGNADPAPDTTTGSEAPKQSPISQSTENTFESACDNEMDHSNEFLASKSNNTTLESFKDELERSNESYAHVLDATLSDIASPPKNDTGTIKRQSKNGLEWTDIIVTDVDLKKADDTWNDNTCPDDATFPTISGSVHMVASIRSEIADVSSALPDLLETSDIASVGPDLTNKLDNEHLDDSISQMRSSGCGANILLHSIPEPSFTSLLEDSELKYNSLMTSAIEKEAARLAAQLKTSQYTMETSVTSLTSLDLNNIKPPSDMGSLLSLSTSGQWDESASHASKKSQKSRKKSLPVAFMVKRALSNSMHLGSSEHLDSNPASFLDNVKPPSEMDQIDLENSMISVSSISSEVIEQREKTPVVFDLKQPIQDFPLCNNFSVLQDLERINPPSLFEEICESTVEMEPTTAQHVYEDCFSNTLNVVTDIPSGSENCTPLPSDVSSVESTPKRKCLTPKERRQVSKDRYQTYTITDSVTENTDVALEVDSEEFLTWTKSESDSRSDDYVTAASESKIKRKLSAKQRRQEDRARYQTQTVNISSILLSMQAVDTDPKMEAKRTIKQKRLEDAERYKTRTLSEDIPPSPTFIIKDVNLENIETTTGYDSLSSVELNRADDTKRIDTSRDIDSGHNEDDFELNSTQMHTYTKSFRNYLPVVESPTAVDMCVVKNLKNIEMTASYQRAMEQRHNPSTSDFASFEGESDHSESDLEVPIVKTKPKIIKPEQSHDGSLDSNESIDKEKGIRGRKKAYVSPYRRNIATKPSTGTAKTIAPSISKIVSQVKKAPVKTTTKPPGSNISPKKIAPVKTTPKPSTPTAVKPLPLERQGTFTKEIMVPQRNLPAADKRAPKSLTKVTTSPSRLPQPNTSKFGLTKPTLKKTNSDDKPQVKRTNRSSYPAMKNSASNHSLQSNDSGKTVTLASRAASRQGSTSSINSATSSKTNVESKIANLWKKVEQSKKQPAKPDKRIWIAAAPEPPKLIRSTTFEGQPKLNQTAKQSSIAIKSSGIPRIPQVKSVASKSSSQLSKKPTVTRSVFARKQVNGQM